MQSVTTFTVDGTVTINGNYAHSGDGVLRITSGDMIVTGNLNLENMSLIIEDGSLLVSGTITTSNDATITTSSGVSSGGNISLTGGGITIQDGGITSGGNLSLTNNAVLSILSGSTDSSINGDFSLGNGADFHYNSTGTFAVSENMTTSGTETKEINVNSGELAVGGDITLSSVSTINIAQNATMSGANLTTGNNSNTIINVFGNMDISQNVDLGGVVNIDATGTFTVGNDYTMRNSSTTVTVVNGFLDVGNNLNINNRNLVGEGLLDWGTLNLNGGIAAINGEKTNISEPVLNLSTMETQSVTLPVQLLSFTAKSSNDEVIIQWQTATELNNDFFTIERSADGREFQSIATLDGNGTTNNVSNYEMADSNPLQGLSYYRLVQTDFDGTTEIFRPVSIRMDVQTENEVMIYPNPLVGSSLNLRMTSPEEGTIEILNQGGERVYNKTLDGFSNVEEMELPSNLKTGIYIVNIHTYSAQKSIKLVKK